MRIAFFRIAALVVLANLAFGQVASKPTSQEIEKKAFVILGIFPSFENAKSEASAASASLSLHFDNRGLTPNKKTGLTFSRSECQESEFDYPCYIPRGRFDDGIWLSVEFSSAYEGLPKGRYIIIVASGSPDDPLIPFALKKVKAVYRESRILIAPVYLGCIH